MTNIQKRFVFCTCGAAIGATLAFQFQTLWFLITVVSGLVGWISADYAGFVASLRKVSASAKSEISIFMRKYLTSARPAEARDIQAMKYKLYFLSFASFCFTTFQILIVLITAYFGVYLVLLPQLLGTLNQNLFLSPLTIPLEALEFSLLFSVVIGLGGAMLTSMLFQTSGKIKLEEEVTETQAFLGYTNPFFWLPWLILFLIKFLARHTEHLVRLAHSDERSVYAICFAGGTVAGFIAGRQFEISHVGGLVAMSVGALVGFSLAWLDWKVLSIKLGWRTVKN